MKNIIAGTIGLTIVVCISIWLDHVLQTQRYQYDPYHSDDLKVRFKVTGTASRPVDHVILMVNVVKEGDDQLAIKQACDAAAEQMLSALKGIERLQVDPQGIEMNKLTDYETKQKTLSVTRAFRMRLDDVTKMEQMISGITQFPGCLIKSTEYRSSKASDLRSAAFDDAKRRMDLYCQGLLRLVGGKSITVDELSISDNDEPSDHGGALFALPSQPVNENLQNAQTQKDVEAKISYDVSVHIVR